MSNIKINTIPPILNTIEVTKPFKSFCEQIKLLESRGLIINDLEIAKIALSTISYYNLINGYKDIFVAKDQFKEYTTMEMLYTIYGIDQTLSHILFKYIIAIEKSLKTILSYRIADKYGVVSDEQYIDATTQQQKNGYLNLSNYSNSNGKRNSTINKMQQLSTPSYDNDYSKSIEHYKNTHGYIPPWVLFNSSTLGKIIGFYEILVPDDKKYVADFFLGQHKRLYSDVSKGILKTSLYILQEYRNNVAHGQRTFNCTTKKILPVDILRTIAPDVLSRTEYNSGVGQKGLLSVFIIIITLTKDPYVSFAFFNDIKSFFESYDNITIGDKTIYELLDIPSNTLKRLNIAMTQNLILQNNRHNSQN